VFIIFGKKLKEGLFQLRPTFSSHFTISGFTFKARVKPHCSSQMSSTLLICSCAKISRSLDVRSKPPGSSLDRIHNLGAAPVAVQGRYDTVKSQLRVLACLEQKPSYDSRLYEGYRSPHSSFWPCMPAPENFAKPQVSGKTHKAENRNEPQKQPTEKATELEKLEGEWVLLVHYCRKIGENFAF